MNHDISPGTAKERLKALRQLPRWDECITRVGREDAARTAAHLRALLVVSGSTWTEPLVAALGPLPWPEGVQQPAIDTGVPLKRFFMTQGNLSDDAAKQRCKLLKRSPHYVRCVNDGGAGKCAKAKSKAHLWALLGLVDAAWAAPLADGIERDGEWPADIADLEAVGASRRRARAQARHAARWDNLDARHQRVAELLAAPPVIAPTPPTIDTAALDQSTPTKLKSVLYMEVRRAFLRDSLGSKPPTMEYRRRARRVPTALHDCAIAVMRRKLDKLQRSRTAFLERERRTFLLVRLGRWIGAHERLTQVLPGELKRAKKDLDDARMRAPSIRRDNHWDDNDDGWEFDNGWEFDHDSDNDSNRDSDSDKAAAEAKVTQAQAHLEAVANTLESTELLVDALRSAQDDPPTSFDANTARMRATTYLDPTKPWSARRRNVLGLGLDDIELAPREAAQLAKAETEARGTCRDLQTCIEKLEALRERTCRGPPPHTTELADPYVPPPPPGMLDDLHKGTWPAGKTAADVAVHARLRGVPPPNSAGNETSRRATILAAFIQPRGIDATIVLKHHRPGGGAYSIRGPWVSKTWRALGLDGPAPEDAAANLDRINDKCRAEVNETARNLIGDDLDALKPPFDAIQRVVYSHYPAMEERHTWLASTANAYLTLVPTSIRPRSSEITLVLPRAVLGCFAAGAAAHVEFRECVSGRSD